MATKRYAAIAFTSLLALSVWGVAGQTEPSDPGSSSGLLRARFDGQFKCPEMTAKHEHSFRDFWSHIWGSKRGPWPMRVPVTPGPVPASKVGHGEIHITWINHATVLIQTDGLNLLTDPIWSEKAGALGLGPQRVCDPGLRLEELPPLDAILVSHNHFDHMDLPTLRKLAKAHSCPVFVPLRNAALLRKCGFARVQELDWWESANLKGGVRLTAVPAAHGSRRGVGDENRALWCGFVVASSNGTIYFAGDTGWGPHFEQIRQTLGPVKIALLPIGSYLPRHMMASQHLSPEEALRAATVLGSENFVPIHYATFPDGDEAYDRPLKDLEKSLYTYPSQRGKVRVMHMGRSKDF